MTLFPLALLSLLACDQAPTEPACDLTVDNLVGKTFVMAEAQPKGPSVLNPQARLTFVEEGGQTRALYTAMSLGDIYSYDCKKVEAEGKDPELACSEKPRVKDWCEALFAHDIKCTKKRLKSFGAEGTDDELEAIIAEAKKAYKEAEASDESIFKMWKLRRASMGNKLQGQVFAKVDSKCRLRIDDMYWTIVNGEKREDTNPVGSNPFVQVDKPYMFEHCDNQAELFDGDKEGFPELPITEPPMNEMDKPIHYYFIGKKGTEPEDGCTYSFDTYAGWLPVAKDQKAEVVDGKVLWHAEHTFTTEDARKVQGKIIGLFHMDRYKTCGGKKERIDVSCRTTLFN